MASTTSGAEPHVATLYVVYGPQRMADAYARKLRVDGELHPADRVVRVEAARREIQGQARRIVLVDTPHPFSRSLAMNWHEALESAAHRNRVNGHEDKMDWFDA